MRFPSRAISDRRTRVGIPWLGWTCGQCQYCRTNRENLCDNARFTGYTIDGGYAEFTVAEASFCFPLHESYSDVEAAPLLCAGLIGYRSLVMAGSVQEAIALGSMALVAQPTSSLKWLSMRAARFTRSPGPVRRAIRNSLARWALLGRAVRIKLPLIPWMLQSSLRQSDHWSSPLCERSGKGAGSSVAEFT